MSFSVVRWSHGPVVPVVPRSIAIHLRRICTNLLLFTCVVYNEQWSRASPSWRRRRRGESSCPPRFTQEHVSSATFARLPEDRPSVYVSRRQASRKHAERSRPEGVGILQRQRPRARRTLVPERPPGAGVNSDPGAKLQRKTPRDTE